MFMFRTAAALAAIVFTLGSAYAADPAGTWVTQKADARIRVAHCGKELCASVAWIKDSVDPKTGKAPVDERNPDPAKRSRKILGLRIFSMESDGQGGWSGPIYNSDDGQTYRGRVALRGDLLDVQGCIVAVCGTQTWTRYGK
jgi:uncharacterized protein (DUF2147 family)